MTDKELENLKLELINIDSVLRDRIIDFIKLTLNDIYKIVESKNKDILDKDLELKNVLTSVESISRFDEYINSIKEATEITDILEDVRKLFEKNK